jgi:hypothetical protein
MGNTLEVAGTVDQLQWMNRDISNYIDESPLKQSESADLVCKGNATDLEFLERQMGSRSTQHSEDKFDRWNLCSLANTAYLSLNSPEPYCSRAEESRSRFVDWYKSQ